MPIDSVRPGSPTPPSVSVLICAYTPDRLELLSRAVASVTAQTVPAGEIVLSIDHCPELAQECRRRWPDLLVVENHEEQGLSGARNTGVSECAGDVVAFLDDDAVAAPDWLERLTAAYANPDVLGAGGAVRPAWESTRPPWFPAEFDWVVGCTHSGMPAEREAVRNLVGANMSFRRGALAEVGGFRHELGRVGTIPAGCEETDLCIRIGKRWPGGRVVYDPAAAVDHFVPATRAAVGYFTSRCRAEGRSKAILAGLVGSDSGLEAERSYVRRTLPVGVARGFGDLFRGKPGGIARAAMIVTGLLTTTAGYAWAAPERRRLARNRERARSEARDNRLRVLMVTPRSPLAQGGVERHVMEVGKRLAADGDSVEVICTEPGGQPRTEDERDGVSIRTLRAWPANRDWCLTPRLWAEIGRRPADVVHVQSYHTFVAPLAMLRALLMRIPYIVTFHGGGHSSDVRNRIRRLHRRLLGPLLRRAARLVAVARFEIEAYGEELGIPPEKFVVIPNGTDLAFSELQSNGKPDGPPLIASIGRLERYKGHHRVIAAFPHVLEHEPQARLMIVGTGPYEDDLKRLSAELGVAERVEFTSVAGDDPGGMAELLRRISLVVLLSDFETHPLVALEAAAARRRLLVAESGGLAELAEDGFARAIPADEEPAAAAAAILEELARPAPTDAPMLTSWDECAGALQELYRSLA
jgi:glycosyltransferase involved in cell wall biosynthesis/GT2 family glycosyltransferase